MLRWSRLATLISLAVAARFFVWALIPFDRFASDEPLYYNAGISLATTGTQDIYLPPMVGWVIAALRFVWANAGVRSLRFAWVAMDLAAAFLLWLIAKRVAERAKSDFNPKHFAALVALAYLLYIPAISFSQFTTSETLAVLLVLGVLVCLTAHRPHQALRFAAGGLLTGLLVLTRANLAGLLVTLPVAIVLTAKSYQGANEATGPNRPRWQPAWAANLLIFTIGAYLVVGVWLWRNYQYEGTFFLSTNSYYNLSIGNSEVYQEDLNLFSPAATSEQMAFRKRIFAEQRISRPGASPAMPRPTPSMDERRNTIEQIRTHKVLFLRRALGRLARLFVPRTEHLELIGGESRKSVLSWPSLTLLVVTNLQWALILVCGVAGLLALRNTQRLFFVWFAAIILGAIPLCLIAISKPRYSFVFDPILLICAVVFLANPAGNWRLVGRRGRITFYLLMLFFAWSWVAWLIFALTSRN